MNTKETKPDTAAANGRSATTCLVGRKRRFRKAALNIIELAKPLAPKNNQSPEAILLELANMVLELTNETKAN